MDLFASLTKGLGVEARSRTAQSVQTLPHLLYYRYSKESHYQMLVVLLSIMCSLSMLQSPCCACTVAVTRSSSSNLLADSILSNPLLYSSSIAHCRLGSYVGSLRCD